MDNKGRFDSYNCLRNELSSRDLEAVMRSNAWNELMGLLADRFNTISAEAASESDVATNMDAEFLAFSRNVMEPAGKKGFELKKE